MQEQTKEIEKSQTLRNKKLLGKHNKSYAIPIYLKDFNPKDYLIIDIRQNQDFLAGHVEGALNLYNLGSIATIAKNNADKKILLYCYSGHTASIYGTELVLAGIENIYYLDESILRFEDYGIELRS